MKKDLEYFKKSLREDLKGRIKHYREHEFLIKTALSIADLWSREPDDYETKGRAADINYAYGVGTIHCVSLNLYLAETDNIARDVRIFIETWVEPRMEFLGLKPEKEYEYSEMKWKAFPYAGKDNVKFMVRAWFGKSTKCVLVPTGEVEEKMRVECKE